MADNKQNLKYIKIDDTLYKWNSHLDSWIRMTNIKRGQDRRTVFGDMCNLMDYKYPNQKAREEINDYWNSYKDEWDFFGETYNNSHILADYNMKKYEWSSDEHKDWFILDEVPRHNFIHIWKDRNGVEHSNKNPYLLVWHQGHLYWGCSYHYMPQIQLWRFNGMDKEPNVHDFVKWTHVKNCKAVWNKTKGCYVG